MVRHQAVAHCGKAVPAMRLREQVQEDFEISIALEQVLVPVAPRDDMVYAALRPLPLLSGHKTPPSRDNVSRI